MSSKCKHYRPRGLPSKFEFVRVEGEGGFGKVVKCIDKESLQVVAIKLPKRWTKLDKSELPVLKMTMGHNLDKHNIVKYIECFQTMKGKALVFESLDISLFHYMKLNKSDPMPMSDIRTIIQQLATALDALKGIGVIHKDLKMDNIMMVNHHKKPLEVKLIDFGLAIPTSQAGKGKGLQWPHLVSPEIHLGREYNEAIDMWALGLIMFLMISGIYPFVEDSPYELMLSIVELLGKPADDLLDKCSQAKEFFTKTDEGVWRLKTPTEYFKEPPITAIFRYRRHPFKCLDNMKALRLEKNNKMEAVEREQCIELLKAMMAFDADERITPSEVLTHPFITKVYPSVQTLSKDFACKAPAATLDDKDSSNIQPGDCTPSPEILPSGAIPVRPVTAENTALLEDQESTVSEATAAPLDGEESSNIQQDDCTPSPEILPSGAILVRPVTAETTTLLEDQESTVSEATAAPLDGEESSNIQQDDCTPSPEILPSGAIPVQPVTAETTTLLEDQESTVSEATAAPLEGEASSNILPDDCPPSPEILPSGAIPVQPVTAETKTLLEDQESTVSEATAAPLEGEESSNIQQDDCTPSPETLPSGGILVRPHSSAKNSTLMEDREIQVSFQSGLNKASEFAVTTTDCNRKISEDSTTWEDTGPKKKGKKKKNCFRRFASWLRKTFSCGVFLRV